MDIIIPAQRTEAEQTVLGAMLIDSGCIPAVLAALSREHFYSNVNKAVYDAICALVDMSCPVDAVTVLQYLKEHASEKLCTAAYLIQLIEHTPTSLNVGDYVSLLRNLQPIYIET